VKSDVFVFGTGVERSTQGNGNEAGVKQNHIGYRRAVRDCENDSSVQASFIFATESEYNSRVLSG
jgi:hypothetical protein